VRILIRGQRFQDWDGRDKVPWSALRVRMNRDNGSVWSGKSFSSRPLQVYFLPTLQRKRKKEKVNVNHETTTRTNIHIYLELSRLTADNRLLSSSSPLSATRHQRFPRSISPTPSDLRRPQKTIHPKPEPGRWANTFGSHDRSSSSRVFNQLTTETAYKRNDTSE